MASQGEMNPESNPEPKLPATEPPPPLPPPGSNDPLQAAVLLPIPASEPLLVRDLLKKEKDREKDKGRDKERDRDRPREEGHEAKEEKKPRDKVEKEKKKKKKEFKKTDPWERYKALHDALKESQDLVDLADHKARFALIIMGALNAAIIILGTRADLFSSFPPNLRLWFYSYLAVYCVIAIYFLVQAIESLRPRPVPNYAPHGSVPEKAENLGLRFFVDANRYDLPTYLSAWQQVRISQLNTELAAQLHAVARINCAKYNAVAKLYRGLQAITLLTGGLLVALGVGAWVDHRTTSAAAATATAGKTDALLDATGQPVKIKSGSPRKGGLAILGEPVRHETPGVLEPSGVAYVPSRGTLFVVGDEGSLVEFDTNGAQVRVLPAGGNLEDITLHTPTGRLVLLSEKKGQLLVYDPVTGRETGKFKLDSQGVLGEAKGDPQQGFEGLAFRPDPTKPGGGVFYLAHQHKPAKIVAFTFDPTAAAGQIGAENVISRATVPGREDLTAIAYDKLLDRLFVVSESKDRIAVLDTNLVEQAEVVLPGAQQEGIVFDGSGNLWIADDRAGLLVFAGARTRISQELQSEKSGDTTK